MKLDLTNTGNTTVPVTGNGWAAILTPGQMQALDYPDGVWLIGDKDNVLKNIGKSIKIIADFIRGKKPAKGATVTVSIRNAGANTVRVIPGDVANETAVSPLGVLSVTGTEYIELRELSSVENPTHDGGGTPN